MQEELPQVSVKLQAPGSFLANRANPCHFDAALDTDCILLWPACRGRDGNPGMLASPACDASEAVTLVPYANATAATTWVLSNVSQETSAAAFGFLANITSLARLAGACAENNATSLGVQTVSQGPQGYDYGSCQIEDGAFLIPGVEVQVAGTVGGFGVLPVSPVYCQYAPEGSCGGEYTTQDSFL